MTAGFRRLVVAAAIAAASGSAPLLLAQEAAPLVLRLPASPRAFGLGNAFVGGEGADVVFYNPAAIGRVTGLAVSVGRFGDASTTASIASSASFGSRLALAAFGQWLDYGARGFPTRPGALTIRGAAQGQSLSGGLAVAALVRKFRLGAGVKYVEERAGNLRGGGPVVDLGVSREVGWLTVGFAAQHLGPDPDVGAVSARLPTRLTLGATTRRRPIGTFFDLLVSAAVSRERGGRLTPGAGLELIYEPVSGWTASIRAGARRIDPGNPEIRPLTLGVSLGIDRLSIDYGYEAYRDAGTVHRLGLRIQ